MPKIDCDIDIDFKDRNEILPFIKHCPASIIKDKKIQKHNVGIYLQKVPIDPITGWCSLDYKKAEERGYFKFDFLNNRVYSKVRDEEHLNSLLRTEPLWEMLLDPEISSQLFQLGSSYSTNILQIMKPTSVEELAMVLALIRPGKKHLVGKPWDEIREEIWKPGSDGYMFKKSHGFAFSLAIVVQMNLLVEEVINHDKH